MKSLAYKKEWVKYGAEWCLNFFEKRQLLQNLVQVEQTEVENQ